MMGQIEVLVDLGEPYVRLADYYAAVARTEAAELDSAVAYKWADTVKAERTALAAEVERLTAENADLRSLPFTPHVLKMGELYREVARLTAENAERAETEAGLLELKSTHEAEIEFMQQQLVALRAQLDAGEGWPPATENPVEEGEYIVAGEYPGEDVFTTACTWYGDEWLNRHTELPVQFKVLRWRPLPALPQE